MKVSEFEFDGILIMIRRNTYPTLETNTNGILVLLKFV